jgi:NADPH2:quinone reductase
MKAIVVEQPGPPEVLRIRDLPRPQLKPGWVLVRVKAFGLNRSEMYTRQGHSGPAVKFPRVLGIECVGVVEEAGDSGLSAGATVAAVMGGMGRDFDGGYAEYALLPAAQVMPVTTRLPWDQLAAIPEMYLTAWGCLAEAMEVRAGQTLLVRGGTSSVGMACISLAKDKGLRVIATSRNSAKADVLRAAGADHVVIDNGSIAGEVRRIAPAGVNGVVELVGVVTLLDSLRCAAVRGIVCYAGLLGNEWALERFEPMPAIPSTVRLTTYTTHTVTATNSTAALQSIVEAVEQGRLPLNRDRVFRFDQIVEAHETMEGNRANGKLVVLVD